MTESTELRRDTRAKALRSQGAVRALEDFAADSEAFATQTYSPDIFPRPTREEYRTLNELLRKHGLTLDRFSADLMDRAIRMNAQRARDAAAAQATVDGVGRRYPTR